MGCVLSLFEKDRDLQELYNLIKMVGEGVEGEVWLASCKATGAMVAIKLIPRGESLGLGPEKVRREIQLQARLSHVNIVELKQVVLTRAHLGIVMGYEPGGDLHVFCNKHKIDEMAARYFFRQIIPALDYCHRHRIAHRDLKLSNFLLTQDDPPRVKLTDFGCAGAWAKKAPANRMARFKTFAGTPAYMAPQVLESAFYPTHTYSAVEADVWACGILLCHMFFGRHTPFWLEPNAYRSEGATALERIKEMRAGHGAWARSNDFIAQRVEGLSGELRDLLDSIFLADEEARITIKGILAHPWYTAPLPPRFEAALAEMEAEQRARDTMARAAISTAAGRHDLADEKTGAYATIDFMVKLASGHGRFPGNDRVILLDMAHMATDGSETASITDAAALPGSPTAATAAPDGDASGRGFGAGGDRSVRNGGDKSRRGERSVRNGGAFEPDEPALLLTRHPGGLVTAEYSQDPSVHGGSSGGGGGVGGGGWAGGEAVGGERSVGGSGGGSGGGGDRSGGDRSARGGDRSVRAGERSARGGERSVRGGTRAFDRSAHGGVHFGGSAHGGSEFFRAATAADGGGGGAARPPADREERSWQAGEGKPPPPVRTGATGT